MDASNMKILPQLSLFQGSLVKWGPGTVIFRRLRLVIGEENDEDHEFYVMGGSVELEGCFVECRSNTAFYVISNSDPSGGSYGDKCRPTAQPPPPGIPASSVTRLNFRHCVLNGRDKCP
jgi:hypothetical protein